LPIISTLPSQARRMAARAGVALAALVALAAGYPAGASATPPTSSTGTTGAPGPCQAAGGGGPGYSASVGTKHNGATICLKVGQKLLVLLSAPHLQGPDWSPIAASPPGVLRPAALTLMLPRGTTAENFRAVRVGTARLRSTRPVCPDTPGRPHCLAIEGWSVTVSVRPR
jgi:hypothetical protein